MRADIPGQGPIKFEGCELPAAAKLFERLPFFGSLKPETQKWLLDLKYAWARRRTAPSALLLAILDEIEDRMLTEREEIHAHLFKTVPETEAREIFSGWLSAIAMMRECAERVSFCTWYMDPLPGEVPHFLQVVSQIYSSMIATQNTKRASHDQIEVPHILETIGSQSEKEQIAFINSVIDGLSDRNNPA